MGTPVSSQLFDFLERTPLPWLHYDKEKRKLILVVDNHLLSTYRACPQHFVYAHIAGLRRKGGGIGVNKSQRNWYLDFGIAVHEVLEWYYTHFREPAFDTTNMVTAKAIEVWTEKQMDEHSEHKEYKLIGGLPGYTGLLLQYCLTMSPLNEKLRVLGTEVSFGKNLEVPLLDAAGENDGYEYYLAGRMDVIVDDGYFICPMDHKTEGTFRGDPAMKYENQMGPTGYIYALKTVLPQFVGPDEVLKRDCSKILMNLIQKTPAASPSDRFKRIPLRKTPYQLELYRQEMVTTCGRLLEDVKTIASEWSVFKNDQVCQNWYHFQCTYFDLCRQPSKEGELVTIQNGFVKTPLWDTEAVGLNS